MNDWTRSAQFRLQFPENLCCWAKLIHRLVISIINLLKKNRLWLSWWLIESGLSFVHANQPKEPVKVHSCWSTADVTAHFSLWRRLAAKWTFSDIRYRPLGTWTPKCRPRFFLVRSFPSYFTWHFWSDDVNNSLPATTFH